MYNLQLKFIFNRFRYIDVINEPSKLWHSGMHNVKQQSQLRDKSQQWLRSFAILMTDAMNKQTSKDRRDSINLWCVVFEECEARAEIIIYCNNYSFLNEKQNRLLTNKTCNRLELSERKAGPLMCRSSIQMFLWIIIIEFQRIEECKWRIPIRIFTQSCPPLSQNKEWECFVN